ncbi:SDR family oxidoreductase [Persicobacter diffluens]|uniref:Dioxygenase n=1 Tax=Persicobacter diffluens TaxID=981 RepID=A0AAN4W470_9BACT|nr:dioxygenase [Persicobacter diffluens]
MDNFSFNDLKGKLVVMPGGTGALGISLATAFAACGAKLAIIGRDKERAENLAAKLKQKYWVDVRGYAVDVTNMEALKEVKMEVFEQLGLVDILVNIVGGNIEGATTNAEKWEEQGLNFAQIKPDALSEVFEKNFKACWNTAQLFSVDMIAKNKGVILNVTSIAALQPLTKVGAYSAAKAALESHTKWLSNYLASENIRVNSLAPGFFLTNQNEFLLKKPDGSFTERGEKIISRTPLKRLGSAEDFQGAALWMCSDLASFLTGSTIVVDGGVSNFGGI